MLQLCLSSDALRETINSSSVGSTSAMLRMLVEDVKLRDREHLASMAVLALHSLTVHCSTSDVRFPCLLEQSDNLMIMLVMILHALCRGSSVARTLYRFAPLVMVKL